MNGVIGARAQLPGTVISDYLLRKVDAPTELVLLLHGYQQTGKHLFEKLVDSCPPSAVVLAPNAPFPIPERKPDGSYRIGFSWYFYNPAIDDYFIDMRISIDFLSSLVKELGFEALPKRIVGFSQGGYLAPFVAARLSEGRQVVGMGCELLGTEMKEVGIWPPKFRMDAIHGELDEVVALAGAQRSHAQLIEQGVRGEFVTLTGVGHRITSEMRDALANSLRIPIENAS
jgi:predicted esterase